MTAPRTRSPGHDEPAAGDGSDEREQHTRTKPSRDGARSRRPHRPAPARETNAAREDRREKEVEETFDSTVREGRRRINRPWLPLFATGFVGGVDVGSGLLAYLIVKSETGNTLLAALAFSIGFIALTLANSELFTENFLVPVSAVVARTASILGLLRLWAGTLVFNLLGGYFVTFLIVLAFPDLGKTAVSTAQTYIGYGHDWQALSAAILAGAAITLMTWLQHATEDPLAKLVAAVAFAFLLTGAGLFHSIIDSLFIFTALHTGEAPFGYLQWLDALWISVLGNAIGGLGLVTMLRLLQVPERVAEQRRHPSESDPHHSG